MAEDDGTVRTGELIPKRASIYGWTGNHQRNSDFFFEPLGYGAGGLFSSARDLATLFAAVDQEKIITRESFRQLTTPATLPNGRKSGFGVGWTVREYHGFPIVGHSGGPALADILHIPSQHRTIVVLTNQQNFYPVIAERIADLTIPEQSMAGIADDQPAVASNLLGLFGALGSGAKDSLFVTEGSDPGSPLRNGFGRALIEAVGTLKQAVLVRVDPEGWRVYRLQFQRKQWDWKVKADSAGRISDMRPA
jgi:hypothetical protein